MCARKSFTFLEIILALLLFAGAGLAFATFMRAGVVEQEEPLEELSVALLGQEVIEKVTADYLTNYKDKELWDLYNSILNFPERYGAVSSEISVNFVDESMNKIIGPVPGNPAIPLNVLRVDVVKGGRSYSTLLTTFF